MIDHQSAGRLPCSGTANLTVWSSGELGDAQLSENDVKDFSFLSYEQSAGPQLSTVEISLERSLRLGFRRGISSLCLVPIVDAGAPVRV